MRPTFASLYLIASSFILPVAVSAEVAINEILFDPAGSDTGLEWVEIFNSSDSPADLTGWQLYPDGVGYFTFPAGFSIHSHSFVTINLRLAGANSATELYHESATGNMGNSSGSLALFSGEPRGKDTIKAFLRYHKPGSSGKKTWESTAVEAGLWQAGAFVDISSISEASSIGLNQDGAVAGFQAAWKIYPSPTKTASNNGTDNASDSATTTEEAEVNPPPVNTNTAPLYVVPRLDVEITAPSAGIIGAPHRFSGQAFGSEKKKVSGEVRYLWNFNDGSIAEGPGVTHTFRFPGIYTVSLDVSSASGAVGSVLRDVTVLANSIEINEVLAGPQGFVELQNTGTELIDISGWMLNTGLEANFTFPVNTKLRGGAFAVFPNDITRLLLASSTDLQLKYANGVGADSLDLLDNEGVRATARQTGVGWALASPTPGRSADASKPILASVAQAPKNPVSSLAADKREIIPTSEVVTTEPQSPYGEEYLSQSAAIRSANYGVKTRLWLFVAAVILSIAAAVFVVVSKKFF